MSPVTVHIEDRVAGPETAAAVRATVAVALDRLAAAPGSTVAVVLTGDARLHALNKTYRDLDRPTDVLSFPADAEDQEPGEPPHLGDILISVERAAASAAAACHAAVDELRLLAVHGLLHLLGHDDETDAGAAEMVALEVELGVRRPEDRPEGL